MNAEYLEIAARLAGRLCRDAIWSGGVCNWTADRPGVNRAAHAALVPQLYSGTAGVALALARVADATGDSIVRATAEGAVACAMARMPVPGCGFYTGGLGVLYAAAEIHGQMDRAAILRQAAPERSALDVISGSAGAIGTLLYFHGRLGGDELIELAVRHGDLLLEEAVRDETGWWWNTIEGVAGQTGFSHGAAGIACALLELWRATGEDRFHCAALEGVRFERSCFDAARGNWSDFRDVVPRFESVWCHGSAGIALSRLYGWTLTGDAVLRDEARIALTDVRGAWRGLENFSLCHGMAGCADILLEASRVLGEPEWAETSQAVARFGIERYHDARRPWPGGIHRAIETPDLMWGTAGIAWFYLRMADPGGTKTILAGA